MWISSSYSSHSLSFQALVKSNEDVPEDGIDLDWTPTSLLTKLPNLTAIIDLTNTFRYYTAQDLRPSSVRYHKLKTVGHVVPALSVVKQ